MERPVHEPLTRLLLRHAGLAARQASDTGSTSKEALHSAASFYISHLPGLPESLRLNLYAGHLPATSATASVGSDAHLFFLLAKARHIADRQRLILWLNGGPGCSSFDGALMEVGPVRMSPGSTESLVENVGAWNEYANVLFLDQPAGTGYSYINRGPPVTELAPAADQVVTFLENFLETFPEFSDFDLYIAGESYAGQYIPYIASAILKTTSIKSPLKGLLMGNAWLDPETQYPAYLDYSLQAGIIKEDSDEAKRASNLMESCNALLNSTAKGKVLVPACEGLLGAVMPGPTSCGTCLFRAMAHLTVAHRNGECVNSYNTLILEPCGAEYPADAPRVKPYLRSAEVVSAFHATSKGVPWEQCNGTVGAQMWSPASRPSVELLPDLLDQDVEVLLFAGELDVVCNWLGVERTIDRMMWKGGTGLNNTAEEWYVNGAQAGTWQTDRGVHWVKIANASHMVAIEKPLEAHDILMRFTGIQPILAVGETAKRPSFIGQQTPSVLGLVAPDGRTLNTSVKSGSSGAIDEMPLLDVQDPALLNEELAEANEQDREAFYGPRRSATLALIMIAIIVVLGLLIRWRARRRENDAPADPKDEEMQALVDEHGRQRVLSEQTQTSEG